MDIYVLPLFVIVCLHNKGENYHFCISINNHIIVIGGLQGRIQDFKLGGGAHKKIAPSGGRRDNFWDISCEKSRFYAKKSYFFQF